MAGEAFPTAFGKLIISRRGQHFYLSVEAILITLLFRWI